MALKITGILVDTQGKAMSGVSVEVSFYKIDGKLDPIAAGKTDRSGRIRLASQTTVREHLPRVLLRAQVNNTWQNISETPDSYTSRVINFGRLEVTPAPALTIARTSFFARPGFVATDESVATGAGAGESLAGLNLSVDDVKRLQVKERELTANVSGLQAENRDLKQKLEIETKRVDDLKKRLGAGLARPDVDTVRSIKLKDISQEHLLTGLTDSLVAADASKADARFRISKMSMSLKVLPGKDGQSYRLPEDSETIKHLDPGLFSTLMVDFEPVRPGGSGATTESQVDVPDLGNCSRPLAERKLEAAGLRGRFYEQQLDAGDRARAGQVLSQFPPPRRSAKAGDEVDVIIGAIPDE